MVPGVVRGEVHHDLAWRREVAKFPSRRTARLPLRAIRPKSVGAARPAQEPARHAPLVELTESGGSGKFLQVAPKPLERAGVGARLMFENSTVCHSRRISLLCPVFCGLDALRG